MPTSATSASLNFPSSNSNPSAGRSTGSRSGSGFQLWHLLLIPPFTPIGLVCVALWLIFKAVQSFARFSYAYPKVVGLFFLASITVASVIGVQGMRQTAARFNGYPLHTFSFQKAFISINGHYRKESVDIYNGDNFGAEVPRAVCSLFGIPHQYIFWSPAVDNHARIQNERIHGWELFKINGGSVRDSTIVVRNGEIVIVGSVTHSTLKARKIVVKGEVSSDSTLITLKSP